MLETSALGKLELQAKTKKGSKRYFIFLLFFFQIDILNLKKKAIRSLSVCLNLCILSVCLLFFSDNIVEVVN